MCLVICVAIVSPTPPAPAAGFVRGDVDANASHELTDAVAIFGYLFLGRTGLGCLDAADADDSGTVEITDGILLLNFLFLGGPQPKAPFPECGTDTSADDLRCDAFSGCESEKERACTAAGGFVTTHMCCGAVDDFPNLCLIGPCSCHPDWSHEVLICDCGMGLCFDGSDCVIFER
jgi:hypothetical protein